MSRYLTADLKRREVRKAGRSTPGGEGATAWCRRLNQVGGLCCIDSWPSDRSSESRRFTLWLTRRLAAAFYDKAPALASLSGVEELALRFKPWGQELLMLTVLEEPHLDIVMSQVLAHFEAISALAGERR